MFSGALVVASRAIKSRCALNVECCTVRAGMESH